MNTSVNYLTPGSSVYYSLLYCDQHSRDLISALHAFYQAIREISFKCQDSQVAQIKYQWWRDEIERCHSQTAQHPVTQIFQSYTSLINLNYLDTIIHTFAQDKKISLYENEIDLNNFYINTAGLLEKIINLILDIKDEKTLQYAENRGVFIQKVLHIRNLRSAVLRGKIYFSGENLLSHRVNLYEFSQLKLTENIRLLLQNEVKKINLYPRLQHARTSLDKKNSALPTLIRANIYKALLKEIERTDFSVFQQNISLTPIRKYWIAWRTK